VRRRENDMENETRHINARGQRDAPILASDLYPTALRFQHLLLSKALSSISTAFLPLISVPTTWPVRATSLPIFK
jgi:phosphohistidine phosphatase SixA